MPQLLNSSPAYPPRLSNSADDHVRREAGRAFSDGVEEQDIKMHFLLGSEKALSEAL
jgi:hypothetical protein